MILGVVQIFKDLLFCIFFIVAAGNSVVGMNFEELNFKDISATLLPLIKQGNEKQILDYLDTKIKVNCLKTKSDYFLKKAVESKQPHIYLLLLQKSGAKSQNEKDDWNSMLSNSIEKYYPSLSNLITLSNLEGSNDAYVVLEKFLEKLHERYPDIINTHPEGERPL